VATSGAIQWPPTGSFPWPPSCIDTTALTVTGSVSLLGVTLDHFSLNQQQATDTIGGSVAGFKAQAS